MRNTFNEQLERLHVEMIRMGAVCEDAISAAAEALLKADAALANTAVEAERERGLGGTLGAAVPAGGDGLGGVDGEVERVPARQALDVAAELEDGAPLVAQAQVEVLERVVLGEEGAGMDDGLGEGEDRQQ